MCGSLGRRSAVRAAGGAQGPARGVLGRPAAPGCVGAARAPWLLALSWWVLWLREVWGEWGVPLGAPEPGVQLCRGDGALLTVTFSSRFEYLFNFDNTFEIHDDIEVLKRMGMACGLESGSCSADDLKVARSLVPKALEPYVTGPLRPGRNARPLRWGWLAPGAQSRDRWDVGRGTVAGCGVPVRQQQDSIWRGRGPSGQGVATRPSRVVHTVQVLRQDLTFQVGPQVCEERGRCGPDPREWLSHCSRVTEKSVVSAALGLPPTAGVGSLLGPRRPFCRLVG